MDLGEIVSEIFSLLNVSLIHLSVKKSLSK